PCGRQEAAVLSRRGGGLAQPARRPLHRTSRLLLAADATRSGGAPSQARHRQGEGLDGQGRAADRPRDALPRRGRRHEAPGAQQSAEGTAEEEGAGARRGRREGGRWRRSCGTGRCSAGRWGPGELMADRVLVAQIGAAHGLRGEVRLKSFTQDPMAVKDYALHSEDARTFTIESLRPAKGWVVGGPAGVGDRPPAGAARNPRLLVERQSPPAAEAGEFFPRGLHGLPAFGPGGRGVGPGGGNHNFGASDIIEIKP